MAPFYNVDVSITLNTCTSNTLILHFMNIFSNFLDAGSGSVSVLLLGGVRDVAFTVISHERTQPESAVYNIWTL